MLSIRDMVGFVDEHHWNVVAHRITQLQPRVVERAFVGQIEQRTLVLRASEDFEQALVESLG